MGKTPSRFPLILTYREQEGALLSLGSIPGRCGDVLFLRRSRKARHWDVGHWVASMRVYRQGPAASQYLLKITFSVFSVNTLQAIKFTAKRVGLMGEMEGLSATLSSPCNLCL